MKSQGKIVPEIPLQSLLMNVERGYEVPGLAPTDLPLVKEMIGLRKKKVGDLTPEQLETVGKAMTLARQVLNTQQALAKMAV